MCLSTINTFLMRYGVYFRVLRRFIHGEQSHDNSVLTAITVRIVGAFHNKRKLIFVFLCPRPSM